MASLARHRGGSRFGASQWLALAGAGLVVLGLTFALGLLVGRQWARYTAPLSAMESPRKTAPASRRSGLTDVGSERVPDYQDKLTFYQTLTAPLGAVPPPAKVDSHAKAATPAKVAPPAPRAPDPAAAKPVAEPRPASASEWTVQVGVFKNAGQAEAVRKRLARGHFDAQITTTAAAEDGQPRYRVRVGAFKSKDDAARTAERVRSDLALSTFVTAR